MTNKCGGSRLIHRLCCANYRLTSAQCEQHQSSFSWGKCKRQRGGHLGFAAARTKLPRAKWTNTSNLRRYTQYVYTVFRLSRQQMGDGWRSNNLRWTIRARVHLDWICGHHTHRHLGSARCTMGSHRQRRALFIGYSHWMRGVYARDPQR